MMRKAASKGGDAVFVLAWGFVKLLNASLWYLEKRVNSNGLHESLLVIMNYVTSKLSKKAEMLLCYASVYCYIGASRTRHP